MQPHNDSRPTRAATVSVLDLLGDVDLSDAAAVGTELAHVDGVSVTVLSPDLCLDQVAENIKAVPRAYMFGGLDRARWVWQPDRSAERYALLGAALDVLARAANVQTTLSTVQEIAQHVWTATHGVKVMGPDGMWSEVRTTRIVDLRDGSPEAMAALGQKNNAAALAKARGFGPQVADSKARNRALRKALGIRGTYDRAEIDRPMILVTFAFAPRPGSQLEREYNRMLAMLASGLAAPPAANTQPAHVIIDDGDDEEVDVIDAIPEPPPEPRRAPPRQQAPERQAPPPQRPEQPRQAPAPAQRREPDPRAQRADDDGPPPRCVQCRAEITPAVHDFSVKHFGQPLCMQHQPRRDQRAPAQPRGRGGR